MSLLHVSFLIISQGTGAGHRGRNERCTATCALKSKQKGGAKQKGNEELDLQQEFQRSVFAKEVGTALHLAGLYRRGRGDVNEPQTPCLVVRVRGGEEEALRGHGRVHVGVELLRAVAVPCRVTIAVAREVHLRAPVLLRPAFFARRRLRRRQREVRCVDQRRQGYHGVVPRRRAFQVAVLAVAIGRLGDVVRLGRSGWRGRRLDWRRCRRCRGGCGRVRGCGCWCSSTMF